MKKKEWLILCIITVVAGLALGLTNLVTADKIEAQQVLAQNAARASVFPGASDFEELEPSEGSRLDSLYAAKADGQIVGYVMQMTTNGYGGPIEVVLGVDAQGKVTGMSVGGSQFAETAGLGARTKDEAFTSQFVGLTETPALGDNIEAISGATISSSAVTSSASKCYQYWMSLSGIADGDAAEEALVSDDIRTVTVQGYGGEFEVTVGVNADGTIEGVKIGGSGFSETAGVGERVLEREFLDQFKGKTAPVSYGDGIDAIAGATVTSTAVLNAINEALGVQGSGETPVAAATPASEEEPAAEVSQATPVP